MVTIEECAQLSSHIYNPQKSLIHHDLVPLSGKQKLPSGYNGWAHITGVQPDMFQSDHFYAALYIKFWEGYPTDAVIAVRGTVFGDWTNDGEDVIGWLSDTLGNGKHAQVPQPFTTLLKNFIYAALQYNDKHYPGLIGVLLTGHSLGGSLAQIAALEGLFAYRVVTFNAPGIGHLVTNRAKEDYAGKIYNINSHYGIINKIGQLIGKLYLVDIPEMEQQAKALYQHFDLKDYEASIKDYKHQKNSWLTISGEIKNIGDDELGFEKRLGSYLKTEQGLVNLPSAQKQFLYCENENEAKHWYQLETLLKLKACEQSDLFKDIVDIIKAQHSIDNMVHALMSWKYIGFSAQATDALMMQHDEMLVA